MVQISKILKEAQNQKEKTLAEEFHIVGLTTVIVDCDLQSCDWHGVNVVIVTDQLVVHNVVCLDVSGLDVQERFQKAGDGQGVGSDSNPGKYYTNTLLFWKPFFLKTI